MNEQESMYALRANVCRNISDFLSGDSLGFEATYQFTEQATAKELYALQDQIDELRRIATANKIIAKAQQKTIDLLSKRLDKVLEFIRLSEDGLDTWEKSDDD